MIVAFLFDLIASVRTCCSWQLLFDKQTLQERRQYKPNSSLPLVLHVPPKVLNPHIPICVFIDVRVVGENQRRRRLVLEVKTAWSWICLLAPLPRIGVLGRRKFGSNFCGEKSSSWIPAKRPPGGRGNCTNERNESVLDPVTGAGRRVTRIDWWLQKWIPVVPLNLRQGLVRSVSSVPCDAWIAPYREVSAITAPLY